MTFDQDHLVFTPLDIDLTRSPLRDTIDGGTFVLGAFNPGFTRLPHGNLLMMVRVAEALTEAKTGEEIHAIRWTADRGFVKDAYELALVDATDPRKFRLRGHSSKVMALTSLSWLLPVELDPSGSKVVAIHYTKAIAPAAGFQEYGVEDARISGGRHVVHDDLLRERRAPQHHALHLHGRAQLPTARNHHGPSEQGHADLRGEGERPVPCPHASLGRSLLCLSTRQRMGGRSFDQSFVLAGCPDGDILLGDRAFCSFELIALLREKGAQAVMRLHPARHAKLDWRRGKKLSAIERLVVWKKPRHQPAGSTMDAQAWQALPEELILRYIKLGYEDRYGTKRMLVVVTTLLDGVKYDALDVATLYARHWDIELKLRDVKTTLGMERYDVRTPEMAARTLWMMTIGCNLLRSLMQRAAIEAGKPVAHMSFKGILGHAVASHGSYLAHRGKPRCLAVHHASVVEACAGKLIDIRPHRREPRATKRRPKGYPLLTRHRKVFREIPHRDRPRSAA